MLGARLIFPVRFIPVCYLSSNLQFLEGILPMQALGLSTLDLNLR